MEPRVRFCCSRYEDAGERKRGKRGRNSFSRRVSRNDFNEFQAPLGREFLKNHCSGEGRAPLLATPPFLGGGFSSKHFGVKKWRRVANSNKALVEITIFPGYNWAAAK